MGKRQNRNSQDQQINTEDLSQSTTEVQTPESVTPPIETSPQIPATEDTAPSQDTGTADPDTETVTDVNTQGLHLDLNAAIVQPNQEDSQVSNNQTQQGVTVTSHGDSQPATSTKAGEAGQNIVNSILNDTRTSGLVAGAFRAIQEYVNDMNTKSVKRLPERIDASRRALLRNIEYILGAQGTQTRRYISGLLEIVNQNSQGELVFSPQRLLEDFTHSTMSISQKNALTTYLTVFQLICNKTVRESSLRQIDFRKLMADKIAEPYRNKILAFLNL